MDKTMQYGEKDMSVILCAKQKNHTIQHVA